MTSIDDPPDVQVTVDATSDEDPLDREQESQSTLPALQLETVVETLPVMVRLVGEAWVRGAVWSVTTGVRVGARLARAATDPRSAAELVYDVRTGMRDYAREFLGVDDLDQRVRILSPSDSRFVAGAGPATAARAKRRRDEDEDQPPEVALRVQAAELLRQSADVRVDDRTHPAYARILQELAPDEARILRLLAVEGPQPAVDVRTASLIGVGSQLVAQGLNMVGPEAGVRHVDRVEAYLNNLQRLGLVQFSDEPLDDAIRYQVLEAQPHVLEPIRDASRAKSQHRTLRLTPFGKDFCDIALPVDAAEIEALTGER